MVLNFWLMNSNNQIESITSSIQRNMDKKCFFLVSIY